MSLYANVELLMILVDVPMQTSIGVMDEAAKLLEQVELIFPRPPRGLLPSLRPLRFLVQSGRVKVGLLWSQGHGSGKG